MNVRKPRDCTSRYALWRTPYHSPPAFSRCSPCVHVAVSLSWKVSEVLSCGVVYSCPSGETPATEMTLNPASRGLEEKAGRPTEAFVRAVFSAKTPVDTRLYPNRRSCTSTDVGVWVNVTARFWPRRRTSV